MNGAEPPRVDPRLVRALHREAMERAGEGRLTLVSGPEHGDDRRRLGRSMLPNFLPGQEVTWNAPDRSPAPGDVVVFAEPPRAGVEMRVTAHATVVHRVIGVRPDGRLVTKGDNRATADEPSIDPGEVIGIVSGATVADGDVDLRSRSGRFYSRIAALISAAGDSAYRLAEILDGLAGHLVPGLADADWSTRVCLRRLAWVAQRAAQVTWHRAAHRVCHRTSSSRVGGLE